MYIPDTLLADTLRVHPPSIDKTTNSLDKTMLMRNLVGTISLNALAYVNCVCKSNTYRVRQVMLSRLLVKWKSSIPD